ncbi:MAG: hypothetical protein RSC93_04300 [Erysipelotrichaceae bacterium]
MKEKKKKGFISIETVFSMTFILFIVLTLIGVFCYFYPRQVLEKEVHVLAQQAKINGGLTYNEVVDFQNVIKERGYKANVKAYVKNNNRVVLNVAPRNTSYSSCTNTANYNPFVKRDSSQKIVLVVTINANDGLLKGPLQYFGAKTFPKNYTISETVMSERNRC